MTRLYGRAPRGERAHDTAPHGHWGVRTLIGSIRGDGQTTCMTIDAPTDKDVFLAYVRKVLVPSLRRGDIAVLDNLRSHKSPEVAAAIRSAGAEVQFLPSYSPDLNPIEKMWSKIKAIMRGIGARHRPPCTEPSGKRSGSSHPKMPLTGSPRVAILFLELL